MQSIGLGAGSILVLRGVGDNSAGLALSCDLWMPPVSYYQKFIGFCWRMEKDLNWLPPTCVQEIRAWDKV